MDFQDWEPVVLKKDPRSQPKPKPEPGKTPVASATPVAIEHSAGHKKFKNLDSDDPDAPKKLGLSTGQQIQKARLEKKLSQEALGKLINEKANVIRDYESGKVVPSRAVIGKLNKALGVSIRV